MASNTVDIIVRAVDKGVKSTFSAMVSGTKSGKTALDAFNAAMGRTQKVASSLPGVLRNVFVGLGIREVATQLWDAGTQAQRLQLAFEAIAGNKNGAADELSFIRSEADRLGLAFYTTADAYKAIFAAAEAGNVPLDTTRKIFTGFSESFAALGLNADQVEGSLRAVSQMMGKNKVLAEELRTQLGEKLPVAIQFFADAAGVSVAQFEKMMANGEVGVDIIKKTADLLSNEYGPKAEEAAKMAVGAMAKFKTAWWDLKVLLSESGFLDASSGYLESITTSLRDPAVQAAIKVWATRFFEVADAIIRTAWEYKGFLASLLGMRVVIGIVADFVKVVNALRVAFTVLTGLQIGQWMAAAVTGMQASTIAAAGLKGAIGALAGIFLAWEAGWQVGTFLTKFDIVKKAGIAMAGGLTNAWLRAKLAWATLTGGDTAGIKREMAEAEKIYAEMFAEIENGGKQVEKSHKAVAVAGESSAKRVSYAASKATEEMKKKYQEYAKLVVKLQEEIAGKQESLTEKLRAMSREGMDDVSAWVDQRAEAEEYYKVAQQAIDAGKAAAAAGNQELAAQKFEEAKTAAEKAESTYESLSNTVERNGQVVLSLQAGLKQRMDGVKDSGELAIEAMKQLETATKNAAQNLNASSGGDLARDLPEVAKAFGDLAETAVDLNKKSQDFKDAWQDAWIEVLKDGENAIGTLEKKLNDLTKDRNIKVYVQEVVKKYTGGLVEKLHSGGFPRLAGKLPGSDGPDRIRALLAPGEFIMRSAAVRKYGAALFHALNSMRLNVGDSLKTRLSGALSSVRLPSPQPIGMFAGGSVPAAAPMAAGNSYTYHATFAGDVSPISKVTARQNAKMVMQEFERMHRRRS